MAKPELHVGDYGTTFRLTVEDDDGAVDISAATTREIIFTKPDGTVATKTAALTGDGTDGQMEYVTLSADLLMSAPGLLKYQGHVVIGTGSWKTDVKSRRIYPNLS
jgi:hypothetical protein